MKRAWVVAAAAALMAGSVPASATHGGTGNGAPNGPHYNLNVIGVDKPKKAPMDDSRRHTIFVPLKGNCRIELVVGDFNVEDGNCFDDGATFSLPNPDPDGDGTTTYSVFARALGKPGGGSRTTTCATGPGEDGVLGTEDDEELCSVITLELTRDAGKTQFKNATKYLLYVYADVDGDGDLERVPLFGDEMQDYFWSYDNDGLRLAQLRFYECATTVPDETAPGGPQDDSDCFGGSH